MAAQYATDQLTSEQTRIRLTGSTDHADQTWMHVSVQAKGLTLRHLCRCSFLEIYSEVITDLLSSSDAPLPLREDIKQGVYVEGLTQQPVECGMPPMPAVLVTMLQSPNGPEQDLPTSCPCSAAP